MNLKRAVYQTCLYSRFFDYPLNVDEVHTWLITPKQVSLSQILPLCTRKLTPSQQSVRRQRYQFSQRKKDIATHLSSVLKHIPSIRLIALTGSLSVNNALPTDDIDLFIITTNHTLWLTRLLVVLIVVLFFRPRHPLQQQFLSDTICLNLWLDESALTIPSPKRNLYTAHEVLQIEPLFDRDHTYYRFLMANRWTSSYLANAYFQKLPTVPEHKNTAPSACWFVRLLNLLSFYSQFLYMKSKITHEKVSLHSAYFHPSSPFSKLSKLLKSKTVPLD